MMVDTSESAAVPLAAHYDVCIAGGGVAGIVLARRLATLKRRVLLLEGGGFEYSELSQDVYRGE